MKEGIGSSKENLGEVELIVEYGETLELKISEFIRKMINTQLEKGGVVNRRIIKRINLRGGVETFLLTCGPHDNFETIYNSYRANTSLD